MEYPIRYDMYEVDEIIDIVRFLNAIEALPNSPDETQKADIAQKYRRYRDTVNNIAEEKRIDKAFTKQTGISIYKTMENM